MSDTLRGSLEVLNELPVSADAERFLEPDDAAERIRRLAVCHPDIAHCVRVGESEEGRPINGVVLGRGNRHVSLLAGNHADEPVGPDFLRRFVMVVLNSPDEYSALLSAFPIFCDSAHQSRRSVPEPHMAAGLGRIGEAGPGR